MKYELSEQTIHNLKVLLERVDLKGKEVGVYVDIINALTPPIDTNKK